MLKLLIYLIFSGCTCVLFAQSTFQVIIEKNDSTSPNFVSHSIIEVHSGDIYATGTINPNGGFSEIRLVKLNKNGVVLWDTTYSNTQTPASYEYTYEFRPEIIPAHDGGVIMACHSFSYSNGEEENKILIWKIDEKGTIEWQKVLSSSSFNDIHQTSDNGYLFLGEVKEDWSNHEDIIVYKTDLNGNVQWKTQLGEAWLDDHVYSIKEIAGQIYVCGYQSLNGWSNLYGALYALDSLGNFLWDAYLLNTPDNDDIRIRTVFQFDNRFFFRATATNGNGVH